MNCILRVLAAGCCCMASAQAAFIVEIGTTNATVSVISQVTANIDGAGTVTLSGSTLDSLNANAYKLPAGTHTASAGFGSSVGIQVEVARDIDTATGEITTAVTGTTPINGLGLGVTGTGGTNADGNFLGSSATVQEGIVIRVGLSALPANTQLQLLGFTLGGFDLTATLPALPDDAGLIGPMGSSTTYTAMPGVVSGVALDGGSGLTRLATFWQPTIDSTGYRVRSLTFDIVNVVVPEPSTFLLGVAVLLPVAVGRRVITVGSS